MSIAAFPNSSRVHAQAPWGEALVDQSLSDWWWPATWDTVSYDELVVLHPSLVHQARRSGDGLEILLRHVLAQRLGRSSRARPADSASELGISKSASVAGFDPSIRARELDHLAIGSSDPYVRWIEFWLRQTEHRREARAFELVAIQCMAKLLDAADAQKRAGVDAVALSHALVGSIHSGINAAYVHPSLTFAHELLAVGAWLGHLLRGRAALMPPFIADAYGDWLTHSDPHDPCAEILRFHAEIGVGHRNLLKAAQRASSKGYSVKVRPRWSVARVSPLIWDEHLFGPVLRAD